LQYRIHILIILLITLSHIQLKGQENKLILKLENTSNNKIIEQYSNVSGDSVKIQEKLKSLITDLYNNGYLSASIDSIRYDSVNTYADLYIGNQYLWSNLDFSKLDPLLQEELKKDKVENQIVNLTELNDLKKDIVAFYENSGYPFAKVKLDSFKMDSFLFKSTIEVQKGDYYSIDSIIIKGEPRISLNYIKKILQIDNNIAFNQDKLNGISKSINEQRFLKEIKPSEIEFREKGVDLYLYIEDKRANMFDGIIGFLPENEKSGKLLITGELNLNLVNSFGRGEELSLNWEKMESSTQKLNVGFNYPYLFGTNLGIDLDFELYKKDSSFLSLNTGLGLRLFLTYDDYLKAYYRYKSSSRIGDDNLSISMNFADIKSNIFGAQYYLNELDYKINPRKGIVLDLFAGAGLKNITAKQNNVDSLILNTDNNTIEIEAGINLDIYFPIYKNFVFHFNNKSRYLDQFADNDKEVVFFENELYRFGGARSLRGFDESIFYASIYSIQNVEIKYLFEQNSAFYIFWNGAYYYKNVIDEVTEDFPWGFGIGLDFETGAGIFSLSYALGKQFENPIEIKTAKIHFGYINRF